MSYDRNPPAPLRFIEDEPVVAPIPVAFRLPTIADLVCQSTTVAAMFLRNP